MQEFFSLKYLIIEAPSMNTIRMHAYLFSPTN